MAYRAPEGFTRSDVDAGGVRLNHWRRGRGRPLLVLHGVTDWGLDWARFAARVDGRLDCILLDQRGHGYSDKPERGYAYADFAGDAWHVIRRLQLSRPAVLGHSMGGGIALALAAAHPEAIDRLLLVDPAIRLPAAAGEAATQVRSRPPAEQRRAQLKARQARGREALLAESQAAHPTWHPEDVANTVESTLLVSPYVHGEQRWFDPEAQEAQLRRLRCPTLVVRGEPARGAIIADEAARRIAELVPGGLARVTTIAGAGHVPQREAFELFVAAAMPFLTGETAPASTGGTPPCFAHLVAADGTAGADGARRG